MKDRRITKLRNKIWISLWASFFAIIIFALSTIYLSNASFHRQQFQNIKQQGSHLDLEVILRGGSPNAAFVIESTLSGQAISIQGDTDFDLDHAVEILGAVIEQENSRIRDRFLWRVPTPFIEFGGDYWLFVRMLGDEIESDRTEVQNIVVDTSHADLLGEDLLQDQIFYVILWNATGVLRIIESLRFNFYLAGVTIFLLLGGLLYVIANLLVKPIIIAMERQKQFVADASHELKTPLTMIKNNLSILRLDQEATIASQKQWLDNIQFGFDRMSHLTTDLLTLAKLENQLNPTNISEFDFSQTSHWIIESMKPLADTKTIAFSNDVEENIFITQDAGKIMQVMTILVDNAIKYADEGGWVKVDVKRKRQMVSFVVKNSGQGISAEKLPHIFDRFFSANETRNSENKSYGLGLAIAKMIIEQSGGIIGASSIENELTTVYFSLKIME